jgi:hypothetical protein
MDTGLNIRTAAPASPAPARIEPPAARQTVASELPEAQAVTAAPEDAPVRFNEEAGARNLRAALNAALDGKVAVPKAAAVSDIDEDAATRQLVFRKIDSDTGRVIGQFPDEAILRLKAYNARQRREEAEQMKTVVA